MGHVQAGYHQVPDCKHYIPVRTGYTFGVHGIKGYKLEIFSTDTGSPPRLHPFVTLATSFILLNNVKAHLFFRGD